MPPETCPRPKFIIVGEAPGAEEVKEGRPFVGQSGKLLNALLKQLGISRDTLHITNAVLCRPPRNRKPTKEELACCKQRLLHEIGLSGGVRVLALGNTAMQTLMGKFNRTMTSQHGMYQPIPGLSNFWMLPTYHPAAVLRQASWFGTLKRDMARFFSRPPVTEVPRVPYTVLESARDLQMLMNYMRQGTRDWAFDVETDSLNWRKGRILCIGLYNPQYGAFVIPEHCLYDSRCREWLAEIFTQGDFIGHNAKFDAKFIEMWLGVAPYIAHDTMLMHYVLDETKGTHGLKDLVMDHFGIEYESAVTSQVSKGGSYREVDRETLYEYLAKDVYFTWELSQGFLQKLIHDNLERTPYAVPLLSASQALTKMELAGVPIDTAKLEQLDIDLRKAAHDALVGLRRMAGDPEFNPRSTKQLAVVLYDKLRMPLVRTKTGGQRTTNKEALAYWQKAKPHPFLDALTRYRRIHKVRTTYVKNFLTRVDEGRVYPEYLLHASVTGRLAAINPAIMTMARPEDEWTQRLRECVAAPEGRALVYCDYSQAEFRVWAWVSQDPKLVEAYQNGSDMHTIAAEIFFGKGFSKAQRVTAKGFNFGFIYRGGLNAIATAIGLPTVAAKQLMDRYTRTFSKGVQWLEDQFTAARAQGYIEEPVFHRRRRFPFVTNDNLSDIRKQSANAPIQALASDLALMSLVEMSKDLKVVLFMHDAVMVECDLRESQAVADKMKEIMEQTARTALGDSVPFVAEAEVGLYWR